jgi:hypothetical protein
MFVLPDRFSRLVECLGAKAKHEIFSPCDQSVRQVAGYLRTGGLRIKELSTYHYQ